MAPLQQHLQMNSVPLVDIPCVYLNDRASWPDFKRAVTECGLIWNLSEWMTTIVYKGTEWKFIHENGTDLSTYFPVVEKTGAGDGKISKTSALGTKLVALLQRPTTMGDLKPSALFCCLNTVEFEDDRRLPARQKLWNWLVFAAIAPLRAHSIIFSTKSRCTTSVTYSKDWSMCLIK